MIPKNIFQTHEREYDELPKFMKAITETWIKMNPTWNYVYMGAKERRAYIESFYPELIKRYDILNAMYQADLWRYIILYNNGGCYADMDSICIWPLDSMLDEKYTDQEMVCTAIEQTKRKDYEGEYVNNANFMSIKNSNILKTTIDTIVTDNKNLKMLSRHYLNVPFSASIVENKTNILFEMGLVSYHSRVLKTRSSGVINQYIMSRFPNFPENLDPPPYPSPETLHNN